MSDATESYEDISSTKRGHMEPGGFTVHVLSKYPPRFGCIKDLARQLREIMFSKGVLFTGTPADPHTLYTPMVKASDDAIQGLNC